MAKERDKQKVINLLIFSGLIFKKINIAPNTVDKPAKVLITKGPIIAILSPLNYMN